MWGIHDSLGLIDFETNLSDVQKTKRMDKNAEMKGMLAGSL